MKITVNVRVSQFAGAAARVVRSIADAAARRGLRPKSEPLKAGKETRR